MANQPSAKTVHHVLATDLDGTLIPLPGNAQNQADLRTLDRQIERNGATLTFVTGRHFESVAGAIEEFRLPWPAWIICDVGTSIYRRLPSGEFEPVVAYQRHQERIIAAMPILTLRQRLRTTRQLQLQEPEKQGRFKLSFYADAVRLSELVDRLQQELEQLGAPYSIVQSVDPFNGDGLIDLLPTSVSKAHALRWWIQFADLERQQVVFAGDSGNDLAALTAGYQAILVGNADRLLAQQVSDAHREFGWENRLYLARGTATSGVLEGCHWFGL